MDVTDLNQGLESEEYVEHDAGRPRGICAGSALEHGDDLSANSEASGRLCSIGDMKNSQAAQGITNVRILSCQPAESSRAEAKGRRQAHVKS